MYVRFGELTQARRLLAIAQRQLIDSPVNGDDVRRFEGELIFAGGERDRGIDMLLKADAELAALPGLTKESLGYAYERAGRVDLAIELPAISESDVAGWEPQQHGSTSSIGWPRCTPVGASATRRWCCSIDCSTSGRTPIFRFPLLIAARKLRGNL